MAFQHIKQKQIGQIGRRLSFLLISCAFLFSFSLFAKDLGFALLARHFEFPHSQKIGIEQEFGGLSLLKAGRLVSRSVRGRFVADQQFHEGLNSQRQWVKFNWLHGRVIQSALGDIELKYEDNSQNDVSFYDGLGKSEAIEMVTSPFDAHSSDLIDLYNQASQALIRNGALGTSDQLAVSLQLNVEVLSKGNRAPPWLIRLLKIYYDPENFSVLHSHFEIPSHRRAYIQDPSSQFQRRILGLRKNMTKLELFEELTYKAIWENLYPSSPYSQTSKNKLLRLIEKKGFEVTLPILKWTHLKLANLFIEWFPNDPLNQILVESGWFKPLPVVEFRAANNDFEARQSVNELLYLVHLAQNPASHDKPLPRLSTLFCEALLQQAH